MTVTEVNDPPTLDAIADPVGDQRGCRPADGEPDGHHRGERRDAAAAGDGDEQQHESHPEPDGHLLRPPNATGSLAYTPVANAFGTAVVTVTVTDGGLDDNLATAGDNGTFTRTFTVTVNPVNDAPCFASASNPPTVMEDAGRTDGPGLGDGVSVPGRPMRQARPC